MAKTQTELLAEVNNNVSELIEVVENKDAVIDKKVNDKIEEMDKRKEDYLSSEGGVNLYQNSRFAKLNDNGTQPLGFFHYYSHGNPQYSIVEPDFSNDASGDRKIVADLVRLVGNSSLYNTRFRALKVIAHGTKDIDGGRHWTLNQYVKKGRGPLTRGCYVYMKPSSKTGTKVSMRIAGNPSGAVSEIVKEVNKPIKIMGSGNSGGHFLGFNLNVYLNEINSDETVEFFIVAPFFVEGIVDGYRTSPIDVEKI